MATLMPDLAQALKSCHVPVTKEGKEPTLGERQAAIGGCDQGIEILRQMAARPKYKPPLQGDGADILLPDLAQFKSGVRALANRSLVRFAAGDVQGAVDDLGMGFRLCDTLAQEPHVIGALVCVACTSMLDSALVAGAPALRGNPDQIKRACWLVETQRPTDLVRSFQMEAFMAAYYGSQGMDVSRIMEAADGSPDRAQSMVLNSYVELTRPYWGPRIVRAWSKYLDVMHRDPTNLDAFEAAFRPVKEAGDSSDPLMAFVSPLVPDDGGVAKSFRAKEARKELTLLGVRAIAGGRRPNVSDSMDPFSKQPYRLVDIPGGWKLYSVGGDGNDDKGVVLRPDSSSSDPCDIVFTWDGEHSSLKGR